MFITTATDLYHVMNCSGSRLLPNNITGETNDTTVRDEGNAAHWYAQELFTGRITGEYQPGVVAYNNIPITPMIHHHMTEYVKSLGNGEMEVETTWGDGLRFNIKGRADFIWHDEETDTLYVVDLKYGYSIVEPYNNWTLISHALGWIRKNGTFPENIVFRIFQPRVYHPEGSTRDYTIGAGMLEIYNERISTSLGNIGDALNTGKHCLSCNKTATCPAFREANMSMFGRLEHAYRDDMSDEELANEIRLMRFANKAMKKRLEALEDLGIHRAKNGRVMHGLMLDRTYSNRTWNKGLTPAAVQAVTGKDLTVSKLCTPAEAKARGVPELFIESLTSRVETGVKLVEMDANTFADKLLGKYK